MKIKTILLFLLISIVSLAYGFAVGFFQIFPFSLMQEINEKIEYSSVTIPKISLGGNEKFELKEKLYGSTVSLPNSIELINSISLNNFSISWGQYDVPDLEKIGAIDITKNNVWYINQKDKAFIKAFGLEDKIPYLGGIKAIFDLQNKPFAYVAYTDGDCASARIYDLKRIEIAFQMPCLPDIENADLNGVGGGFLKISDNEVLLGTGTPSVDGVDSDISILAQDDQSLWGKILSISLLADQIDVSIFSKGQRNPQGIFSINNVIYGVDHGPMGGDELNILEKGANHGWPIQSLGSEYGLKRINKDYSIIENNSSPLLSFVPSIGISSVYGCPTNYSDYYSPQQCVAVSSLRAGSIFLIVHDGAKVLFYERINLKSRIRKFQTYEDSFIAITDFDGIIIGKLSENKL
ncbi:PQQ-dependent sugar dehydrogenase [Gammaproteobacteria bacterium]|nr:PQQ-dependent sugar dehydrogenase [Gammaproteobacteria bacterium]